MGPVTPNKIVSYTLLFAGFALLIGGRVADGLSGSFWVGIALILLGLSCLVDALLPGGSELTDEQIVMIRHMRIPYRAGAEKVVGALCGLALLAGGVYISFG